MRIKNRMRIKCGKVCILVNGNGVRKEMECENCILMIRMWKCNVQVKCEMWKWNVKCGNPIWNGSIRVYSSEWMECGKWNKWNANELWMKRDSRWMECTWIVNGICKSMQHEWQMKRERHANETWMKCKYNMRIECECESNVNGMRIKRAWNANETRMECEWNINTTPIQCQSNANETWMECQCNVIHSLEMQNHKTNSLKSKPLVVGNSYDSNLFVEEWIDNQRIAMNMHRLNADEQIWRMKWCNAHTHTQKYACIKNSQRNVQNECRVNGMWTECVNGTCEWNMWIEYVNMWMECVKWNV